MPAAVQHGVPTDRRRKPLLLDDGSPSRMVGIDTIALRGRVHRDTLRSLPLLRMKRKTDTISGVVTDSDTSAEVKLAEGVTLRADVWRGEPEVRLECSVPKRLRQDNTFAATVAEARTVIEDLWSLGDEHVRWEC